MKRALIALVLLGASAAQAQTAPSELWDAANRHYQAGEYAQAAQSYEQLVQAGVATADVYFNLGTAELKAGRRGAAVLAFERAARLDPSDADVAFNLAEARRGIVDKVVGAREEEPLVERIGSRVNANAVGAAFLAAWVLGLAMLALRPFVRRGRGALLGGGVAAVAAALVLGALLSAAAWTETRARYAVVVAPVAGVREGPAADFKAAFEVHEGLKVRVVGEERRFLRVRLPNGLEGWVDPNEVQVI